MTTDFRALCAELVDAWDDLPWEYDFKGNVTGIHGDLFDDSAVDCARALLDQQEPQPPAAGEVAEVLQWPAEWSRRQRAQEAEMLCCSAGMTPGKEMQRLVRDARDGMPLQHLHDLISHAIPTPQPPAAGEVVELVDLLKREAGNEDVYGSVISAAELRRAADLLEAMLAELKALHLPEGYADKLRSMRRPTTLSPESLKAWDEAEANIQASMQRIKELTAPLRHPAPSDKEQALNALSLIMSRQKGMFDGKPFDTIRQVLEAL